MDNFEVAVSFVLRNEGGFIDNPADSGGATNFGISLRFLREVPIDRLRKYGFFEELTVSHICHMTIDQARLIYRGEFWEMAEFAKINEADIASYIFDMCVHHGIAQGVKLAQRALWAEVHHYGYILDDGKLGNITLGQLNASHYRVIGAMMAERAGFMRLIAATQSKDKEFLHGWLTRCYRL